MSDTEHEHENLTGGEVIYRAADPGEMTFNEATEGRTLEGRMVPYNEWTEVDSPMEGHFLERFAPGALAKTIVERGQRVRALFQHGLDPVIGSQAIAVVDTMREEPDGVYYSATLLDGLSDLLLSGLRRGLYGSSVNGRPVKTEVVRRPGKSEHNPMGLPEVTRRELSLREFSVVTIPQYGGATALLRSMTDEMAARQLMRNPTRLLEIIEQIDPEPQHSERTPQEDLAVERSRSTQPVRDYLKADEGEPEWLL